MKHKHTILFILHMSPPIHGAAMVGDIISNSTLIKNNYKSRFINLSTSSQINNIGVLSIVKIIRFFEIFKRVARETLFNRPSLVYLTLSSHGQGLIKDLPIVLILKLLRIPILYHFHNKGVNNYANKYFFAPWLYTTLFKNESLILLSPLLLNDVQLYTRECKIYYCANAIPRVLFNRKTTHPSKIFTILFLSNLNRSKGIIDLLDICKNLKKSDIDFNCIIVGIDGDLDVETLRNEISNRDLVQNVIYEGARYGKEKAEIFSKADLFILPTLADCFPLVLLEAMSAGLPIISTIEGAIPEIIDDKSTGFLSEKGNVEDMHSKILEYYNDKGLLALHGKNGLNKFNENYQIEQFERRLDNILQSSLSS